MIQFGMNKLLPESVNLILINYEYFKSKIY